MTGRRRLCVATLLATVVMVGLLAGPAAAAVRVQGRVLYYNPITEHYEPVREARLRLVLREDYDWDTLDVEGHTNSRGEYHMTKGNPWWRNSYRAFLIVFAEVPGRLEVQQRYLQIDGYQARTAQFTTPQNATTTRDVYIGGPQENVNYRAGGIAALGNSDSVPSLAGQRAFFLFHEATDHRLRLQAKRLTAPSDFEEKEIAYPIDQDAASYCGILDYIKVPDFYFDETLMPLERNSNMVRHEMSHGIMGDQYWFFPSWWVNSPDSHMLSTVSSHEFAWVEGWAEFMAEVTQKERYGKWNDLETQEAGWRAGIPLGADRSKVEGEVAAALWDIYDPKGWELCFTQYPELPEPLYWYDGIEDPSLDKIWWIFKRHRPDGFTHATFDDMPDSFVWYWLHRTSFGQKHELKAILWNRGIRWQSELPQHPPSVTLGDITWEGNVARIPVTVTEQNPEDRPWVRVLVYVNDGLGQVVELNDGWNGAQRQLVIEQPIAWVAGSPPPTLRVVAHDNMEAGWATQTLDPPAGALIGGLAVEITEIRISRFVEPPAQIPLGWTFPPYQGGQPWTGLAVGLRCRLTAQVRDHPHASPVVSLPGGLDTWYAANREMVRTIPGTTEIHRQERLLPLRVFLTVHGTHQAASATAGPVGGFQPWVAQTVEGSFGPGDNFGLGSRTAVIEHSQRYSAADYAWMVGNMANWIWVERTKMEVDYEIKGFPPSDSDTVVVEQTPGHMLESQPLAVQETSLPDDWLLAHLGELQERPPEMTPTRLLSRMSRLTDDYARLQGELTLAAAVLQSRLEGPPEEGSTDPLRGMTIYMPQPRTQSPGQGEIRQERRPMTERPTGSDGTRQETQSRQERRPMTQRPTASGRTREELETDAAHLLRFTPDELMVRPATPLIDQIAADRAAFSEDLAVFQAMTAEQREHMTELRSILVSGEASLHRIEQERQELQLELDEILAQLAQRDHPLAAEPIVLTHVRDLMGLVQRQIERKADSLPEFLHLSRNVKQVLDAVLTPTELTPTPLTPVPGAPVPGGPAPGEPVRRPGVTR